MVAILIATSSLPRDDASNPTLKHSYGREE